MAFVEHLGGYFSDFGEVAIWKGKIPITVIFDNEYNLSNGIVDSLSPAILVEAVNVVGIKQGQTIKIKTTTYQIVGVEPDATGGLITARLAKQ